MLRTLANGQLAATTGTLLNTDPAADPLGRFVNMEFHNTSTTLTEHIVVQTSRAGGTARTVADVQSVGPHETLVVNNLAMGPGDTVTGSTTDATTVDYDIAASNGGNLEIYVLDKTGARKAVSSGYSGAISPAGLRLPSSTVAAAGADNTDAALVTEGVSLVTGANATKGVILPATFGIIVLKNDDTANAVLKVYPPSGAKINALTTTTGGISMAAKTCCLFVMYSATQVYTVPLLPS